MKNILISVGITIPMFLVACVDFSIENPDSTSPDTRASNSFESKNYYWSGGRKIYLDIDPEKLTVGLDADIPEGKRIPALKFSGSDEPFQMTGEIVMHPKRNISAGEIMTRLYVDGEIVKTTETGIVIVRLNDRSNTLSTANAIYESGLVDWCHPDFLSQKTRSAADLYFPRQWNLNNTGQKGNSFVGIDINVQSVWAVSTGDNIRVAVIDDGVEDHPDLAGRVLRGFTPRNSAGYGVPEADSKGHGQACAGVIAASHNALGLSGVAPEVDIIPINIFLTGQTVQDDAAAIEYAWNPNKGNADVINNSWSFESIPARADYVTQEIRNALTLGRGGKGCVVVFSSGNENNSTVNFPASSHPDIIVVGAISHDGKRKTPTSPDGNDKWGSNYGSELDVVAPGVDIITTDLLDDRGQNPLHSEDGGYFGQGDFDYFFEFNGTSAAAPHVAGVAALLLSADPSLTALQVAEAIEYSVQKVGGHTYTTNYGHYNGLWNNEMGYGLVDAAAALASISDTTPRTPVIATNTPRISPGGSAIVEVYNRQQGATYEWDCTGGPGIYEPGPKIIMFQPPPGPGGLVYRTIRARSRAHYLGQTSAWSNTVSISIASTMRLQPAAPADRLP